MQSHLVYLFDPISFHQRLESQAVIAGQVDLERLRTLAIAALDSATPTARKALDVMRFDQEWLRPSDEDADRERYWYIITLAQELRPAPAVRYGGLVRLALSYAGWTYAEARVLIFGESLGAMLRSTGHPVFDSVNGMVDTFAGALSVDAAGRLLTRLKLAEPVFRRPAPEVAEAMARDKGYRLPNQIGALSDTYDELDRMLSTSLKQGQPLVMLFD
jgi:hypothetical protein